MASHSANVVRAKSADYNYAAGSERFSYVKVEVEESFTSRVETFVKEHIWKVPVFFVSPVLALFGSLAGCQRSSPPEIRADDAGMNKLVPKDTKQIIDPQIIKLIDQLKDPSGNTPLYAAKTLGEIGEQAAAAVPELIRLLKFPPPHLQAARWEAAKALGKIGKSAVEAIPELILFLDPTLGAQREAAMGLCGIGEKAPVAALLKDWDPMARTNALIALGSVGERAASEVPEIIPLLKDPDGIVQRNAIAALGKIGEKAVAAVPELTRLLKDPGLKDIASEALGRIVKRTGSPVP